MTCHVQSSLDRRLLACVLYIVLRYCCKGSCRSYKFAVHQACCDASGQANTRINALIRFDSIRLILLSNFSDSFDSKQTNQENYYDSFDSKQTNQQNYCDSVDSKRTNQHTISNRTRLRPAAATCMSSGRCFFFFRALARAGAWAGGCRSVHSGSPSR